MGLQIEDGLGSGRNAQVDVNNRIRTRAVTLQEADDLALIGEAYSWNSTTQTLTTATESGMMWIGNMGTLPYVIPFLTFQTGSSTGGTGVVTVRLYRNPTGGTLFTGANAALITNRNHSSSRTLVGNFYRGTGAALTVTGGAQHGIIAIGNAPLSARLDIGDIILFPGNTLAITVQAPAGNTSMACLVAGGIHERQEF